MTLAHACTLAPFPIAMGIVAIIASQTGRIVDATKDWDAASRAGAYTAVGMAAILVACFGAAFMPLD